MERGIVEDQLHSIESDDLVRRAHRWSVEIPSEWERGATGDHYLSAKARDALRRTIRDERRKEIKWWVDLMIPILALLVALASVMSR